MPLWQVQLMALGPSGGDVIAVTVAGAEFPRFPETSYLSGIGGLRLEGSRVGLMLSGLPGCLVFVGRKPTESGLNAPRVVPSVDVAEQRRLRLDSRRESGCGPVDQLDLDGRPQVLGEGVVEANPRRPRSRAGCRRRQPLGKPDRGVLGGFNSVVATPACCSECRCSLKASAGCSPAEGFAGSGVEGVSDGCDVVCVPAGQVGALRKVLA